MENYDMIFKRKSFHLFRNIGNESLTVDELADIDAYFSKIIPLNKDIKVKMIIDKDNNTCHRGQEYCILFYSEEKDNYLQNIGYIGEQIDLYLTSKNIATLWFGIGRVKEKVIDGLHYVIMIAIAKADNTDKFRKDMFKSKRKDTSEIWRGDKYLDIANIVRFAPSACNSQPWQVVANDTTLEVYRQRKDGKVGIMPKGAANYYNQIDIGIFIYFLDLCLNHNNILYERVNFLESKDEYGNLLNAKYILK